MAQLKAMNGGEITASRRLKKKTRTNKRTFYYGTYYCRVNGHGRADNY